MWPLQRQQEALLRLQTPRGCLTIFTLRDEIIPRVRVATPEAGEGGGGVTSGPSLGRRGYGRGDVTTIFFHFRVFTTRTSGSVPS